VKSRLSRLSSPRPDWNTRTDGANIVHGETSFERADGSRGVAADVSLAYQQPPGWVEPSPQLILQIIADMATQLALPREALVSVVPEPLPFVPGVEENLFG